MTPEKNYRTIPLLIKLGLLSGGWPGQLGWIFLIFSLPFCTSIPEYIEKYRSFELALGLAPIFLFTLVGLLLLFFSIKKGILALQLLKRGLIAQAKFNNSRTINRKNRTYELTFNFTDQIGKVYSIKENSNNLRNAKDKKNQSVLYDPFDPNKAKLVNALPLRITIDENDTIENRYKKRSLAVLILPILFVIVLYNLLSYSTDPAVNAFEKGIKAASKENYGGAVEYFTNAIKYRNDYAKAYYHRGDNYYELAKQNDDVELYTKTIDDFEKALELDPFLKDIINYDLSRAYSKRGGVYFEMVEFAKAARDFDQSIKYDPEFESAYYNAGISYQNMNSCPTAIERFTKGIDSFPEGDLTNFYLIRGYCYADSKKPAEAISDYNQVLKIKPDHANAIYNRGGVLMQSGKFKAAAADFNTWLKLKGKERPELAKSLRLTIKRLGFKPEY